MRKLIVSLFLFTCQFSLVTASYAEVIERIVAIVNEDIILFSEFQRVLQYAKGPDSPVLRERVLNDMIDNMLLLNEARRYRTGADKTGKIETDDSIVIGEYIDRRIKALIHVPYEDIEHYYQVNIDRYRDKSVVDVRDEIEGMLVETELKIKVREHLKELRKKAYIRVQLNEEN